MVRRIPGLTRFAALAALALLAAQSQPASAQLFWDWGGKEESNGSGREVIRFDSKYTPGQIIVSFGDRRLYLITRAGEAISYPVAIPREQDRWQGVTKVSDKKVNPAWRPTPDMLRENPKLPAWVPGGHRMNPLGVRALYLGSSTYRIHGTDAPWTIGTEASKGCIRMFNRDVLDLYPRVPVGTKVTVTWQRFEGEGYAVSGGGRPAEAWAGDGPVARGVAHGVARGDERGPDYGAEPSDDWASEQSMQRRGERLREMAPDDIPYADDDPRPY
jgi:lipoprotein-anchoring transpeptidase ErfK/SrfK